MRQGIGYAVAPGLVTAILAIVFSVTARPRSPALAAFVASFHYHEAEVATTGLERILPTGRIHLMVNLLENEFRTYHGADFATYRTHGAVLAGPASQSRVIDTTEQCCLVTVDFKLGGATPFFALPLSEAQDQLVELDELWGCDGGVLREQLLEARTPEAKFQIVEAILLDHLGRSEDRDPAILLAATALNRGVPVSGVASCLGFLPKTFVRRFRKQTGLTPKRFSRVRRLQRVVRSISDPRCVDWAALAAEHGYTDQAHLGVAKQ